MLVLETLAQQFALDYSKAEWSDVEDDVSLGLWIERTTGETLDLREIAKMRTLLDAEVAKFPKIVIYVEGGVVQSCTSNDPRLQVVLIDRDNLREEEDAEQAESEALEGTEDCTHEVF
jgi:hypothetical protein